MLHESDAHHTTPRFPSRRNTVTAETLARFLQGEKLSQQDATRLMSTTRLSPVVFDLRHHMAWDIYSDNETALTKDGRKTTFVRYRLSERQREQLDAQAVADYCQSVFAARKARREAAR